MSDGHAEDALLDVDRRRLDRCVDSERADDHPGRGVRAVDPRRHEMRPVAAAGDDRRRAERGLGRVAAHGLDLRDVVAPDQRLVERVEARLVDLHGR